MILHTMNHHEGYSLMKGTFYTKEKSQNLIDVKLSGAIYSMQTYDNCNIKMEVAAEV